MIKSFSWQTCFDFFCKDLSWIYFVIKFSVNAFTKVETGPLISDFISFTDLRQNR